MIKKILNIIGNIAFFVAMGVIILTLFTAHFPVAGIESYVVLTGSMEPKIHVASVVFVKNETAYKEGDIITFKRGNITVTHRIHSIIGGMYQTKGDANKSADEQLVAKKDIIGREFVVIPYLGRFTSFLKTVPGFIIFMVLPILFYVVLEARVLKQEWEKEIEKKILARINMSQQP